MKNIRMCHFSIFLLLALFLTGCFLNITEKHVEKALLKFNGTLNTDPSARLEVVRSITYNEPTNPFWPLSLWATPGLYHFKSWNISVSGTDAYVELQYTFHNSEKDEEYKMPTAKFSMRKFGKEWKVNLSEFIGLN
jgi:hypothetical protein